MRLFGHKPDVVPEHVKAALETVEQVHQATDAAHEAVEEYWRQVRLRVARVDAELPTPRRKRPSK